MKKRLLFCPIAQAELANEQMYPSFKTQVHKLAACLGCNPLRVWVLEDVGKLHHVPGHPGRNGSWRLPHSPCLCMAWHPCALRGSCNTVILMDGWWMADGWLMMSVFFPFQRVAEAREKQHRRYHKTLWHIHFRIVFGSQTWSHPNRFWAVAKSSLFQDVPSVCRLCVEYFSWIVRL